MTRPSRTLLRGAALRGAAAAGVALVALAVPAFAHVEAEGETAPTGLTTVTFGFTHGCEPSSPTTSLKIKLPDGTTDVKPVDPAGWTSAVADGQLTWSGGSVPFDDEGSFEATMRIVGTKGDTVFLPTIQGCAQGENAWLELSDDPEASKAAPRITLTETVAPTTTASTTTTTAAVPTTQLSADAAADAKTVKDSENSNVGTVVIIIVVLIIVAGAVILYLRNRRPTTP